ncbi:XdhC family protein [Acidocella sp.]|uniref:XdhC family protein n=1 Tax=Acidocella sp. TaxID=50710 RepID=UPI003D00481B
MLQTLRRALQWASAGEAVALATVLRSWGSAPCPAGSVMAISASGAIAGAVSGGCVEGAVCEAAEGVLKTGRPARLDFGVADELAWSVGLACGGRIEIHVGRFEAGIFAALLEAADASRPVVLARRLDEDEAWLLPSPEAPAGLTEAAAHLLGQDKPDLVVRDEGEYFLQPVTPPPRLIIVGAVQIAQTLVSMARLAGYGCVVVDPRAAFCTAERFPGTRLLREWPRMAFTLLRLDARSAVVTLTHDPKFDDPALREAVMSPAFYVGALGSRRTHAARLARLRDSGVEEAALARIQAPVGMNIGAVGGGEIAVSILAAVIAARRRV